MVREASLVDFPYKDEVGKYLLHKEKQQSQIMGEFCSATMCCRGQTKDELIYRVRIHLHRRRYRSHEKSLRRASVMNLEVV